MLLCSLRPTWMFNELSWRSHLEQLSMSFCLTDRPREPVFCSTEQAGMLFYHINDSVKIYETSENIFGGICVPSFWCVSFRGR
jgi:hypothetical protein